MVNSSGPGQQESLWAITSYYNPMRYRRRVANYRRFRHHLNVPLVAVELAWDGTFELHDDDAEIMVRVSAGDVMWQKERLLNVALDALPSACRYVVWIDCDVLVDQIDWSLRLREALERWPLAQAFARVYYLRKDVRSHELTDPAGAEFWQVGFAHAMLTGDSFLDSLRASQHRIQGASALGFAWGARRELLERHRFYDACIIGGGDVAMVCAAYGALEELEQRQRFNPQQCKRYRAWAEPFHASVRGQVGVVDSSIFHLWHGDMANRRGGERHDGLSRFEFDPNADMALTPDGAWRWNSDKPGMHQYVTDYFANRREDG